MLGVRSQTSSVAVLADSGRFSLLTRQRASAIKYLSRLMGNKCPELLKRCYEIQLQLYQSNHPCWLSTTKRFISNLNLQQDNPTEVKMLSGLYDQSQSSILNAIKDSVQNPKLRTYKLFKNEMRLEPYLIYNFPKPLYCSIARFRLSSHNLNIELGRHKRPYVPPEDRICIKCELGQVEDEFHCLMYCSKWNDIRAILFVSVCSVINEFNVLSPTEQFRRIMSDKGKVISYALGKFLLIAMKLDGSS
jgi:hypothetical protein